MRALLFKFYHFLARMVSLILHRDRLTYSGTFNLKPEQKRCWIHVASAGELESVWTLVKETMKQGYFVILTYFSPSAERQAKLLAEEIKQDLGEERARASILILQSPFEGQWKKYLDLFNPEYFLTVKYEAWPELWISLTQKKIPLFVLGARPRLSLRVAAQASQWVEGEIPEWHALCFRAEDKTDFLKWPKPLQPKFVDLVSDPRIERISERMYHGKGFENAKEHVERYSKFPKPWGILGSAWPEDIDLLADLLKNAPGSVFIFPHRIDPQMQLEIHEKLLHNNLAHDEHLHVILEMGFLAEFYQYADWAYVGGGLDEGVHSVLEPAIQGLPISCGSYRRSQWVETEILREMGQLQIIQSSPEALAWLADWFESKTESQRAAARERWQKEWSSRRNGTELVLNVLKS